MRSVQFALICSVAVTLALPTAAATRTRRNPSSARTVSKHAVAVKPKLQSQRGIDDQRATQIQTALIKAGYLSGPPSGHWDAASSSAMEKVQADNGWQTKLVPDSRALIKLGLGPSTASADALVTPGGPLASQPNSLVQNPQ